MFKSLSESDAQTFYDDVHWFYYYDHRDRLIEVKHVPDTSASSTYSIYDFYWFEDRPLAYYQHDLPARTLTRRYVHADELGRPLEVWSWPTSGDASRVWAINPDVFGWDEILVGASVYQPLRFPGQYYDEETIAWEDNGDDPARPALHYNWHRTYDPFTGTYLQVDPMVEDTWEAYTYVSQDPVGKVDPTGELATTASLKLGLILGTIECDGSATTTARIKCKIDCEINRLFDKQRGPCSGGIFFRVLCLFYEETNTQSCKDECDKICIRPMR